MHNVASSSVLGLHSDKTMYDGGVKSDGLFECHICHIVIALI